MLQLFKFIDSGFLLTLGLLLLIGGSIMLYCYRRLNLLERSIIEHGKILQNFIANYNIHMNSLCLMNKSYTNYESCCETDNFEKLTKKINNENKIQVSDDEEDDYEDDEEEEDEDEDDEEDDEEEEEEEEEDEDEEDDDEGEDKVTTESNLYEIVDTKSEKLIINELDNKSLQVEEVTNLGYINSDEDIFIKNLPILLNNFDKDLENNSKVITLENSLETIQKVEKKNYSKMRIDDLRSLVVTKNILDNDSAQKMKKNDLVKLLQN
jgi:hypothetical protein